MFKSNAITVIYIKGKKPGGGDIWDSYERHPHPNLTTSESPPKPVPEPIDTCTMWKTVAITFVLAFALMSALVATIVVIEKKRRGYTRIRTEGSAEQVYQRIVEDLEEF